MLIRQLQMQWIKNIDFGSKLPNPKSTFCRLLAMWVQESYLASLRVKMMGCNGFYLAQFCEHWSGWQRHSLQHQSTQWLTDMWVVFISRYKVTDCFCCCFSGMWGDCRSCAGMEGTGGEVPKCLLEWNNRDSAGNELLLEQINHILTDTNFPLVKLAN